MLMSKKLNHSDCIFSCPPSPLLYYFDAHSFYLDITLFRPCKMTIGKTYYTLVAMNLYCLLVIGLTQRD